MYNSIAYGNVQEDHVVFTVSSEEGNTLDTVEVSISITNARGVLAGEFVLSFDSVVVRPAAVRQGNLISEADSSIFMSNVDYGEENELKTAWIAPYGDLEDDGIICIVEFQLIEPGETTLELYDIILAPEELLVEEPVKGSIIVHNGNAEESIVENEEKETKPISNNTFGLLIIVALIIFGSAAKFLLRRWNFNKR